MTREKVPARVTPPGKIIQREIEARGWTQKDLADIIERPPQAVNEIIKGIKQITPDTALELGAAFGTSPEFWMNLEANYRLWLASAKKDGSAIEKRGKLYSLLPIREMTKRGWIGPVNSAEELEVEIRKFLNTDNLEEPITVNFRCSFVGEPDYPSKLAWFKRVEQLARPKEVKLFNPKRLEERVEEFLDLSVEEVNIRAIPAILSDCGIKFVIVPQLPKTYIDGAAFFLDDSPVVALSLRYDRVDSFWFNLCHELSHILYGHGQLFLDVESEGKETAPTVEENEANERAKNWLINPNSYQKFLNQVGHFFSRRAVIDFASSQKRHPGIVVGRLQRDGLIPYQNHRAFLTKVSPFLNDLIDY